MASVLVIAVDPPIEALLGQLLAFAGHRPAYDATLGAAGEAIRRVRPDAVLLDSQLPRPVVQSCMDAAAEAGTSVILTSSSANEAELAAEADSAHCPYFALPAGASKLAQLLQRTLVNKRNPPHVPVSVPVRRDIEPSVNPALCAALAGIARARVIAARTHAAAQEAYGLRPAGVENRTATRKGLDALRAAVSDYARQLQSSAMSEADAIARVSVAVNACATVVGAEHIVHDVMGESEEWARTVYRAA